MQLLMFYIFSLGAVLSATLMVTNIRPVTAAMNLIMTMFFLAGIYVLLDAHLIAALQIIVYAGAIMVLFLFVILLLNIHEKEGETARRKVMIQFGSIAIVGTLFIVIAKLAVIEPSLVKIGETAYPFGTTKAVGKMLFTDYLLPFEIASVLLLAAIVGAVILAKRRIDD
ncbi:MAG: NADH-quinone oxidoreductase subunit J [Deltaproteobacteria bacterium]|nr:NADH-quinone oxidoreductase subunit J [Deltaproteobacteria bacterium]